MANSQFEKLYALLSKALKNNDGSAGFAFDGQSQSLEELLKKFARDEMIDVLKKRSQEESLPAKKWVPLVAQIDFMSAAERDTRLRFRNRIQAFNLRNQTNTFASQSLDTFRKELMDIEGA